MADGTWARLYGPNFHTAAVHLSHHLDVKSLTNLTIYAGDGATNTHGISSAIGVLRYYFMRGGQIWLAMSASQDFIDDLHAEFGLAIASIDSVLLPFTLPSGIKPADVAQQDPIGWQILAEPVTVTNVAALVYWTSPRKRPGTAQKSMWDGSTSRAE